MPIEYFHFNNEPIHQKTPMVTVTTYGQLLFSKAATRKFNIKKGQLALLGYDIEKKLVIIKFLSKDKSWMRGSRRISGNQNNTSIQCRPFFDKFKISFLFIKRYEIKRIKPKIIGFHIGEK